MNSHRTLNRHTADLVHHSEWVQQRALKLRVSNQRAPMGKLNTPTLSPTPKRSFTDPEPPRLPAMPSSSQVELRTSADVSAVREEIARNRVKWAVHHERASRTAPLQAPLRSSGHDRVQRGRGPKKSGAALSLKADKAAAEAAKERVFKEAAENACWARIGRAILQDPSSIAPWEAPKASHESQTDKDRGKCASNGGNSNSSGPSYTDLPVFGLPTSLPAEGLPVELQRLPPVWDKLGFASFEREAVYRRLNEELVPQVRKLTNQAYERAIGSNGRGMLSTSDRAALDRQLAEVVKRAYATCVAEAMSEVQEAHAAVTRLHGEIAQSRRNARAALKAQDFEINDQSSNSSNLNSEASSRRRHRNKVQDSEAPLVRTSAEDFRGSSSNPRSTRSNHSSRKSDDEPRATKNHGSSHGSSLKRRSSGNLSSNASSNGSSHSHTGETQMGAFPWNPLTGSVSRRAAPLLGTMEILMEELDLQKEMTRAQQRELAKQEREGQSSRRPKNREPGAGKSTLPPVSEQIPRTASAPVCGSMGSFY